LLLWSYTISLVLIFFKLLWIQITLMGFMMLLLSALLGYVSGTRVHQFSNASHYLSFCQMIWIINFEVCKKLAYEVPLKLLKFLYSSRYTHLNWTRLLQDGLILHTGYFCFYTRLVKLSHCRISLLTVTSSCKFNAQVSD
jgi:hypothetical protein